MQALLEQNLKIPEFTLAEMYKVGETKSVRSNGNFQTLENTRISSSWCSNKTKDTPDFHDKKQDAPPSKIEQMKGESLYLLTFAENEIMKGVALN